MKTSTKKVSKTSFNFCLTTKLKKSKLRSTKLRTTKI